MAGTAKKTVSGLKRKGQPYAYAKRGKDGKWRHWTAYVVPVAKGLAMAGGFMLGKWLFGDITSLFGLHGLTHNIVEDVKGLFK